MEVMSNLMLKNASRRGGIVLKRPCIERDSIVLDVESFVCRSYQPNDLFSKSRVIKDVFRMKHVCNWPSNRQVLS